MHHKVILMYLWWLAYAKENERKSIYTVLQCSPRCISINPHYLLCLSQGLELQILDPCRSMIELVQVWFMTVEGERETWGKEKEKKKKRRIGGEEERKRRRRSGGSSGGREEVKEWRGGRIPGGPSTGHKGWRWAGLSMSGQWYELSHSSALCVQTLKRLEWRTGLSDRGLSASPFTLGVVNVG